MKKHNWIPRILAALVCLSLVIDGGFFVPMQVKAAEDDELPEKITLPITLLDFNADNLLFQYDLYDAGDFALTGDMFTGEGYKKVEKGTDTYVMQGLVKKDLNPKTHTPVYRQETVEQVARMVIAQMTNPSPNHDTQRFKDLLAKLATPNPNAINAMNITDLSTAQNLFFKEGDEDGMGWVFTDIPRYQFDQEKVKDANGNIIWEHYYGIHHLTTSTHTLTKTIDGLNAGNTYVLEASFERPGLTLTLKGEGSEPDVAISFSEEETDGTHSVRTIEFTGREGITLQVQAEGDCILNYLKLKIKEQNDSVRELVVNQLTPKFSLSGWKPVDAAGFTEGVTSDEPALPALLDGSGKPQWWFESDGLVNGGDSSSIYKELTLNPGKTYIVTDARNPDMHVEIQDMNGKLLVENMVGGSMFTAPTDGRIKIVVTGTGDGGTTEIWPNRKLARLSLMESAATLGIYEDTETYFKDGTKGYNDIRNCMDYAYFVLNNFWIQQNNLSWRSSDFNNITLKALDDKGNYGFFADVSGVSPHANEKVFYDREARNIRNDEKGTPGGLFPLDWADSWGVDEREDYTCGTGGHKHNFHYSLYSHATFIYEKDANLYFDFVGDDDVYLFINGQLAMDIGGAHLAAHDHIEINELIADGTLDELKEGRAYTFDFFYMERHTEFSNLAIQTNIQLLDDGTLDLNFYDEQGNPLKKGDKVKSGSKVEMEYEFHVYVDGVTDVNFKDEDLGIEIGIGGLKYGDNISLKNGEITIIVEEPDKEPVEYTFDNEDDLREFFEESTFNRDTVVRVRGLMYTVDKEKGDLHANVSVSFKSPNYAGAVDATSDETASDLGHLTVSNGTDDQSSSSNSTDSSKPSDTQKPQASASGQTSPGITENDSAVVSIKSPKTGDETPVGRNVAVLLLGAALVGAAAYLKRQEQECGGR